tara:strand:- start:216 stop:488 length:273 start_codon:yes stop_codon:yes gene_type:complete
MKISILLYAVFIFYIFGKNGKIPDSAMNLVWSFGIGGPLFLSTGILIENFILIKGGIFILLMLSLILLHQIINEYYQNKEVVEEETKNIK